jgi:hypothetical protein
MIGNLLSALGLRESQQSALKYEWAAASSIGSHYLNAPPNEAPLSLRNDPESNSSIHMFAFRSSWHFPAHKTCRYCGVVQHKGLKEISHSQSQQPFRVFVEWSQPFQFVQRLCSCNRSGSLFTFNHAICTPVNLQRFLFAVLKLPNLDLSFGISIGSNTNITASGTKSPYRSRMFSRP